MYDKPNVTLPLLLFATPPPLDKLRALSIRVGSKAQVNQIAAKFQPQVIKCREFIFTEPDVIGTPSADVKDNCFHLIAQISLLESGRLQSRLSRIGLEVTRPYEVSPELYQSCLRYTLIARISPVWNKAGQWLIQGRDFLTHTGCANAVKMDLSVNHNELFFTLEATAVRFSPLKVSCLDIMGKSLEAFLTNTVAEIHQSSIASDWCYVLPSMKKGRIVSIAHELPEDSPFMSYRDIKRHWKNMYGFRLPESDEDLNYYQIHFGPLGGKLFTYPEVCLRAQDIQTIPRVDPKPILRAFIQAIQSKFPTICGQPMKLQSKAKFPVADLFECGQENVQPQPNLSNKMSAKPPTYRSSREMDRMLSDKPTSGTSAMATYRNPHTPVTTAVPNLTTQPGNFGPSSRQFQHQTNCSVLQQKLISKKENKIIPHINKAPLVSLMSRQPQPASTTSGIVTQRPVSQKTTDSIPNYGPTVSSHARPESQNTVTPSIRPTETPVKNFIESIGGVASKTVTLNSNSASSQPTNTRIGLVPGSQQPNTVAGLVPPVRKLFPQFTPKKNTGLQTNNSSKSNVPVVPMFNKQKKFNNTMEVKCLLNKQNDRVEKQWPMVKQRVNTKVLGNTGKPSKTVKRKADDAVKSKKSQKEGKPEAKRKRQKLKAAEA